MDTNAGIEGEVLRNERTRMDCSGVNQDGVEIVWTTTVEMVGIDADAWRYDKDWGHVVSPLTHTEPSSKGTL